MNQKIITIAGIVFALIFIVLLAVMMSTITEKTNNANAQMVDTLAMTEGTDISSFDGSTSVRGNMVTSAIKSGKSDSGKNKMFYVVTTGVDNPVHTYYGYASDGGSEKEVFNKDGSKYEGEYSDAIVDGYTPSDTYTNYNVTDTSSDKYINERASYRAFALYSQNGVAVGVQYIQEGASN